MKRRLATEFIDRTALREHLANVEVVDSCAAGGATLYRVTENGEEHVLLTLPDGGAAVIRIATGAPQERRWHPPTADQNTSKP